MKASIGGLSTSLLSNELFVFLFLSGSEAVVHTFAFVKPSWLSGWRPCVRNFCTRGVDSIPVVTSYLVWDGGQWRDSLSSARVDPALNGYLEKSREGKQEGCVEAQDGYPLPQLHFLAGGP